MLVLSRKPGERVYIGNGVVVTVVAVDGRKVRLGVEAPPDVRVMREELLPPDDPRRGPQAPPVG